MMGKSKARKSKSAALTAVREMQGPAVVSMLAERADAIERCACGWQPLGTSGDQVIMVADAEALASWNAREVKGNG